MIASITKFAWLAAVCGGALMSLEGDAHARTWTCHVTFNAGDHSYTPEPWTMSSSNPLADRQARCLGAIQSTWIANGSILALLGLSAEEKDAACNSDGTVYVRYDYGFDERDKSWAEDDYVTAPCACDSYYWSE